MDSNITDLKMQSPTIQELQEIFKFAVIPTAIAFVLLSIASNSFTLVVLRSSEIFYEIDLILYRLLAVEDMISSIITLTSFIIYATVDFSTVGIHFFWFCQIPFLYQTICVVLPINICRYLMIARPLHYPMWVTRKRIIVSQAVLFVMSFVLPFLLTLLTELIKNNGKNSTDPIYMIPIAIGFLVQVFTGSHILYISVRQSRRLQMGERAMFHQEHRRNGPRDPAEAHTPEAVLEPRRRLPSSFKGLKTVLVLIGSYWIAWFPVVLNTFKEIGLLELPDWVSILASTTILVNSCWNPLIYYLTNRAFRDAANRTIRRMKSKMCQLCKRQIVPVVE